MDDKQQVLTTLRDEFNRWEALLAGMSEEQITAPRLHHDRSIKDEIAHLRVWQQRSIARLEAVLQNREPVFPKIPDGLDAEAEDVDQLNAWIYETTRNKPWVIVHREWREGFQRFLSLGEAISERNMLDKARYRWMDGYSPADIMMASYEHHHVDHYEPLLAALSGDRA